MPALLRSLTRVLGPALDRLPPPWNHDLRRLARRQTYERKRRSVVQLKGGTENHYSFPVFDERRAIFIHIPKCAGTSLSLALFGCLGAGHLTARDLRLIYGRDFWHHYRFTVVRNPFARLVSAYTYLVNGEDDWAYNQRSREELAHFRDFDDFVANGLARWAGENLYFRPQLHFLDLDGRIPVDTLARVETLADDFEEIRARVNPEAPLTHANRSRRDRSLAEFYADAATVRTVRTIYGEDFDRLGYPVDPGAL